MKIQFINSVIKDTVTPYCKSGLYDGMFYLDKFEIESYIGNDVYINTLIQETGHAVDYTYFKSENYNDRMNYANVYWFYLSSMVIGPIKDSSNNTEYNYSDMYNSEAAKLFNISNFKSDINFANQEYLDCFGKQPMEYFSECFSLYYCNDNLKQILKDNAPKTYAYIEAINRGDNFTS